MNDLILIAWYRPPGLGLRQTSNESSAPVSLSCRFPDAAQTNLSITAAPEGSTGSRHAVERLSAGPTHGSVSGPVAHMPLWALCLLVALSGVLDARSCSSFTCPAICRCSAHTLQCSRESQLASRPDNVSVSTLWLPHLPLTAVPTHAFKELINITLIEISMSDSITRIQRQAFLSLHSLEQISVQNINSLRVIEKAAFTDLPRLKYLRISNTGLLSFPDFTNVNSLMPNMIIEVMDNVRIVSIPANSFQGITEEYVDMTLVGNSIKEIKAHAFNGTKLNKLVLKDNGHLSDIHEDAFEGAIGPTSLDVSSTALRSLPSKGLKQVRFLKATSAFALKTLPPLESLTELMDAELTYSSHCCAFHSWRQKERERALENLPTFCDFFDPELPLRSSMTGLLSVP
ncbi:lutropin-choriogonadotropic hormone receptor-like isoform X7 [Scophthalmus maximus]|uniref:lutropin-choriogonadotropic hormone receptor-like isoform X7 n=1 Tax=Scophthalmus maximus TaxID=52904 RepID=UPI001FA88E8C|nr:lutropin-choriogonadotropic hormone receptor-like isoform X7 [Scophthalmus maximus]